MRAKIWLLAITLVAAAGLFFTGCDKLANPLAGDVPAIPENASLGDTLVVTIWAGQHYDAGDVLVWMFDDSIYVRANTTGDWVMTEMHMAYGDSCAALPRNNKGHLVPGLFPFAESFDPPVTTFTFSFPNGDHEPGDTICFAVHVVVEILDGDSVIQEETGWGGQWRGCFCWVEPPTLSQKRINLPEDPIQIMGKDPIFEGPKRSFYSRMMLDDVPGDSGDYNIWNGEWTSFCLEQNKGLPGGVWHTADVWSSYADTSLMPDPLAYGQKYSGGWVVDYANPTHYDWINYLVNYVMASDPLPFTYENTLMIQHIVWYWRGTYSIYGFSLTADEETLRAEAETNGNGFYPDAGEWFAVLFDCGRTVQLSFIIADP